MLTIITTESPDTAHARALIAELEAQLKPLYPPESQYGYAIDDLLREKVPFFVMHRRATLAGCGGVQLFGADYGEIKRMYVRPQFRGLGLAKLMLNHLAEFARQRGVGLLRLETGIHQTEAIGLYERLGFRRIGPFGTYRDDPLSLFFEKRLR